MSVAVRRMTTADLEQVWRIDLLSLPLPWSASAYRRELQVPHSRPWVAETVLSGELVYPATPAAKGLRLPEGSLAVIGLLVIWLLVDEAHVATLAVHPAFRRQGIAAGLLRSGLRAIRQEGAIQAMLEVRAGNAAAQHLYESVGFTVVGRRKAYYKDNGEDAVLMTLADLQRVPE